MTIAAISRDELDETRGFARSFGIGFPLISDVSGEISRALVGIDTEDLSIPGVVVIRRDGTIVFRQVATSRGDRLTARALLDAVDRSLGTSGRLVENKQPAFHHAQLRFEGGYGRLRAGGEWHSTVVSRLSINVPLGRYLVAGTGLVSDFDQARFALRSSLGVRLPLLDDIGALQLSAEAGLPFDAPGVYAGLRLGLWYAGSPRWALHLDGSLGAFDAGAEDQQPGWAVTAGVSRLFGR